MKPYKIFPPCPPCPPWWSGLFVLLLAATTLVAGQTPASPIKLGFLTPLSGAYAQNGRDILNGLVLYLDEIGYRAAGRPIGRAMDISAAEKRSSSTRAPGRLSARPRSM